MNSEGKRQQLIKLLRAYMDDLDRERTATSEYLELLSGQPPISPFPSASLPTFSVRTNSPDRDWEKLKPQKAVLRFLSEHRGKAYKPNDIAKELRKLHVKGSERKTFVPGVYGAANRLVEQEKVLKMRNTDGKWMFQINEKGLPHG